MTSLFVTAYLVVIYILFPLSNPYTCVNESMEVKSTIDYFLTSKPLCTVAFNTIDLDVNLCDHLPIMALCLCEIEECRLRQPQ